MCEIKVVMMDLFCYQSATRVFVVTGGTRIFNTIIPITGLGAIWNVIL